MLNPARVQRGPLFTALLLAGACCCAQTTFTVGNTEVHVSVLASNLNVPWDMVMGPDGWIWFTEIDGHVSRLNPDDGTLEAIYTVPDVHETGLGGGLQSMAFHPDFANQPYVYLHYVNTSSTTVVKRFYYDEALHTFTSQSPHLLSVGLHGFASHNGSRLVVDDAGMFLLSVGDCMGHSADAPDLSTTYGKVLRFDPEGGIPADNPIPDSYVYNWGHRNPQGLVKAANGHIYNSSHGAGHDDEVNLILPNRDYGWPAVYGLPNTAAEIDYTTTHNAVSPMHEWTVTISAPSGIDYYASTAIPEWHNAILVATLVGQALHVLNLNAAGDSVVSASSVLYQVFGRFRDVLYHPDGRVFLSTSNNDWGGVTGSPNDDLILELSAESTTGDAQLVEQLVHLWPNPASGRVTLSAPGQILGPVLLRDAVGRTVAIPVLQGNAFDVSTLAPGLYQLSFQFGGILRMASLVIEGR